MAQQYTLTIFHGVYVFPHAINTAGQVAGTAAGRAVVWTEGAMQELGRLPGTDDCDAFSINDAGWVVGSCSTGHGSVSFLWNADMGMAQLPIPGSSSATGISNGGHIVGYYADLSSQSPDHAFIYREGEIEDLGPGHAFGINDEDQVVGDRPGDSPTTAIAHIWDDQGDRDLDDEGGSSGATAISAIGVAVGHSTRGQLCSACEHAVLWAGYGVSDLGTLGEYPLSRALAINGNLIVGESRRAFVYDVNGPGYAVDLNTLIEYSPYRLVVAAGINAAGQITGTADCCGEAEGFLLTPVPPDAEQER
jgi:probable HAF family extracellular repeat protein